MNGSVLFAIIPVLICLTRLVEPIQGGACLTTMNKNGLCKDVLADNITKEDCCRQFPYVSTAWSGEDLQSGILFFQLVSGLGVPCDPCRGVGLFKCLKGDCGPKEKCVVRSGRPRCVCSPCTQEEMNSTERVCGSDGNTYLNECRLKKRACQKSDLTVAYPGYCQSSCDRITCPRKKFCVLDQNLSPHCVRCNIRCSKTTENSGPVCGANGVTYPNVCVLRQKACKSGKAIPVAYKGRCKARATCGSVRCKKHQSCLTDASSGLPRCVTCSGGGRCRGAGRERESVRGRGRGREREPGRPICGTNNKTYHSWCHMVKDACATGFVIETKFRGPCERRAREKTSSESVPVPMTSRVNASGALFLRVDPQWQKTRN